MTLGIWIESTVSERIANLHREAEHQRLAHFARLRVGDSKERHGGWVHRHGWLGGIRAASIQLQRRSSWPGQELLTQRGDRS